MGHSPGPMTDVDICERSGIEFAELPAGGWRWRTTDTDGEQFPWKGPFSTKAEAAGDCVAYCGFEFEGDLVEK